MPIYVYEPTLYSTEEEVKDCCFFETLQSMSEEPLSQCPTCLGKVHRAVTSFNMNMNFNQNKKVKTQTEEENHAMKNGSENSSTNSPARNAARFASRHICSGGCAH